MLNLACAKSPTSSSTLQLVNRRLENGRNWIVYSHVSLKYVADQTPTLSNPIKVKQNLTGKSFTAIFFECNGHGKIK